MSLRELEPWQSWRKRRRPLAGSRTGEDLEIHITTCISWPLSSSNRRITINDLWNLRIFILEAVRRKRYWIR